MPRFAAFCLALSFLVPCLGADFYVSPDAKPGGDGKLETPFSTPEQARDAVRELRQSGKLPASEPVTVYLRAGLHTLGATLEFLPEDGNVTWTALPGESATLSGGRVITGWERDANGLWSAPLTLKNPEAGTQLFVRRAGAEDFTRATRARTPNVDPACASNSYFFARRVYTQGGCREIKAHLGELDALLLDAEGNLVPDVRLVVFQKWSSTVLCVSGFNPETGRVTFPRATPGTFFFDRHNRYYVENCRAALDQPGEWFFDRAAGRVWYLPREGEDPSRDTLILSLVTSNLVQISGDWAAGKCVRGLNFQRLNFSFSDANLGPDYPASVQAAHTQRGAVNAVGWRDSELSDCVLAHLGENGVTLLEGCRNIRVVRNHIYDLGAGGVCFAAVPNGAPAEEALTADNLVDNNIIHHGGNIFHAACGVLFCGQAQNNRVTHNDISNFYWAAVQIGWCWSADTPAYTNRNELAFNHIHHYGSGVLCDLAGIYTLGDSAGTALHHNHIHDGARFQRDTEGYGGWGIYYDQGTANILAENNLVYNVPDGGMHIHNSCWPFNEVIRNNIFAFSTNVAMMRNNTQNARTFPFGAKFEHNVIFNRNPTMLMGSGFDRDQKVLMTRNLYWSTEGEARFKGLTLAEWQEATGLEEGSVVADPLFQDPERYDFRLREGSPALEVGFQPFDVSDAGVYDPCAAAESVGKPGSGAAESAASWRAVAAAVVNRPVEVHSATTLPDTFTDDFESYEPGDIPDHVRVSVGGGGGYCAVDALPPEAAEDGNLRAMKLVDSPDLKIGYEPHFYVQQPFRTGLVRMTWRMWIPESYPILVEWRQYDTGTWQYAVGPAFRVQADGSVTAAGRKLTQLPAGVWVQYEIRCGSGPRDDTAAPRTWTLCVTVPGEAPRVFEDLPVSDAFQELGWVGFISPGKQDGTLYVDDLQVE